MTAKPYFGYYNFNTYTRQIQGFVVFHQANICLIASRFAEKLSESIVSNRKKCALTFFSNFDIIGPYCKRDEGKSNPIDLLKESASQAERAQAGTRVKMAPGAAVRGALCLDSDGDRPLQREALIDAVMRSGFKSG